MFGLNILYIFSVSSLIGFGGLFFLSDLFMLKLKKWKANKLYSQSQVFKDPQIDNVGGLLDLGVLKAKMSHLLVPNDKDFHLNYLRLQLRTAPTEAIIRWSDMLKGKENIELRNELFQESFKILTNQYASPAEKKLGAEIAFREVKQLLSDSSWSSDPENQIKYFELLAQTGNQSKAIDQVIEFLNNYPQYPEAIFLLARICTNLEDASKIAGLGRSLASLASRQNEIGLKAIRHMTLLHLLKPLSIRSIDKCIELLKVNPKSEPIDYMRVYALKYSQMNLSEEKREVVDACSSLFDLEDPRDILIFGRWLSRIGAFESTIAYIPAHKARVNEPLFKIRTGALLRLKDFEKIHREIAQATLISSKWKIILEAHAFALAGNYEDSVNTLDNIIPLLEPDPREFENVCEYFEDIGDIRGLCHILEHFSNKATHARFSLTKLIQYRAGSADAISLLNWLEKLAKISPSDSNLHLSINYLKLLDPDLVSPSQELNILIDKAKKFASETNLPQAKISLALAHLRNNSPDLSLVAIGNENNWRLWANTRPAWCFLVSQVFRLNNDTEKALVLLKNINFESMDYAEKQSLQFLFPKSFDI